VSALKRAGYGDGRTGNGRMGPGGDWMAAEHNGTSATGIPLPGYARRVLVPLDGQPPIAVHGDWGATPASWGTFVYGQ
jgi:hypothetical protein